MLSCYKFILPSGISSPSLGVEGQVLEGLDLVPYASISLATPGSCQGSIVP